MPTALNMTAPLKQDPASQQRLQQLAAVFVEQVQPKMDAVLAKSQIVHFARVLVIDDKYIQVITEFDGSPEEYTEFFRKQLPSVFEAIFSLVEGAPPWEELNNPNTFHEFTHGLNVKSLGTSTDGNEGHGYMFSAFGDTTVREIKKQLSQQSAASG
jgi:hypothetical protein